jgi:hypothetical protein
MSTPSTSAIARAFFTPRAVSIITITTMPRSAASV